MVKTIDPNEVKKLDLKVSTYNLDVVCPSCGQKFNLSKDKNLHKNGFSRLKDWVVKNGEYIYHESFEINFCATCINCKKIFIAPLKFSLTNESHVLVFNAEYGNRKTENEL